MRNQIIDPWRKTKAHRADTKRGVRSNELARIWQSAFEGDGAWDFDFTRDDASF